VIPLSNHLFTVIHHRPKLSTRAKFEHTFYYWVDEK